MTFQWCARGTFGTPLRPNSSNEARPEVDMSSKREPKKSDLFGHKHFIVI
jgi:hypothetical protein